MTASPLRPAALLASIRQRPRLWLAGLAALCFAVALFRPGLTWTARAGSSLLVIDITQSMNVSDVRWDGRLTTRLEYTRALLRRTIRELNCGHQVGIGVFTERRTMILVAPIEVCAHYAALDDVLAAIDWRMAWAADSHLFYGVYSALDEIAAQWPGSALAFFTDGHQAPPFFPGFEPRFERSDRTPPGFLFGIGGNLPQPVPHLDSDGRITGYWTADEALSFPPSGGRPTLSVLDMERMGAGVDVRNKSQRPPGSEADHLSQRRDATLEALSTVTGLKAETRPPDAPAVIAALRSLPGDHIARQRLDLHDPLVALGGLALLLGLVPTRTSRSLLA